MIDNETTVFKRTNDTKINNYRTPLGSDFASARHFRILRKGF